MERSSRSLRVRSESGEGSLDSAESSEDLDPFRERLLLSRERTSSLFLTFGDEEVMVMIKGKDAKK